MRIVIMSRVAVKSCDTRNRRALLKLATSNVHIDDGNFCNLIEEIEQWLDWPSIINTTM